MVIRLRQTDRERDTQMSLRLHQGIGLAGSPRTPSYSWDGRNAAMARQPDRENTSASAVVDSKNAYSLRGQGGDDDASDEISAEGDRCGGNGA